LLLYKQSGMRGGTIHPSCRQQNGNQPPMRHRVTQGTMVMMTKVMNSGT